MTDDDFERGLALRRTMFGPEGADQQIEKATAFTSPMQDWVTRRCFGEVWHRGVLDHKTRSMLTLAMLVAMGRGPEIRIHTKGAIANGVTKQEIQEIFMHAMIYCGVPHAVDGFRSADEVLNDLGID